MRLGDLTANTFKVFDIRLIVYLTNYGRIYLPIRCLSYIFPFVTKCNIFNLFLHVIRRNACQSIRAIDSFQA